MAEVAVVIPTRGRPRLLARAVASVEAQRGVAVELRVVHDDGEPPLGPAAARNRGLAAAQAPFVAFLDDDDTWAPDKLVRQLAAIGGAEWCTTGVVVGERTVLPPVDATFRRRNELWAGCSTVLARTSALRAVGGFDESLPASEDWDLWLRLAARGPLATVAEPLATYTRHGAARSLDPALVDAGIARVVGKHNLDLDLSWSLLYRASVRSGAAAARLYLAHACRCRSPRSLARAARALL